MFFFESRLLLLLSWRLKCLVFTLWVSFGQVHIPKQKSLFFFFGGGDSTRSKKRKKRDEKKRRGGGRRRINRERRFSIVLLGLPSSFSSFQGLL